MLDLLALAAPYPFTESCSPVLWNIVRRQHMSERGSSKSVNGERFAVCGLRRACCFALYRELGGFLIWGDRCAARLRLALLLLLDTH
jgi:hypothetical protein